MKKITLTICTLCILCISCTSSQVNYIIKGTVNGMDGKKVSLFSEECNKAIIDSTVVNGNSFIFKGILPKICFASISVGRMKTTVILENGTINVSFDNWKVTGTPTNDILNACNEKISMLDDESIALLRQKGELLKNNRKDKMDDWKIEWKKFTNKQTLIVKECINQNLDNIVGSYLLHIYDRNLSEKEFTEILTNASPTMKENYYTKETIARRNAVKSTEVGQKFTDFKLKDPNDREVSLSDYVGKGKYVLIDFWASWCAPCRIEIPYQKVAYEKYASKGFEIVGVSLDTKKEDWVKAIKKFDMIWPQMSDLKGRESVGAKLYGVNGIPSTLLVDPNGIIIAKDLRDYDIENKLEELLN